MSWNKTAALVGPRAHLCPFLDLFCLRDSFFCHIFMYFNNKPQQLLQTALTETLLVAEGVNDWGCCDLELFIISLLRVEHAPWRSLLPLTSTALFTPPNHDALIHNTNSVKPTNVNSASS